MVTFCFLYPLQFLAHDTDKSPELKSRDFDIMSDVMLPIPVPKVSAEKLVNEHVSVFLICNIRYREEISGNATL